MTDAARRLPRGRHGLSRDQVALDQRQRMLLAMAEAMAADGYVATSVADVIKRAGVSRETYYQQFSSKLDCFLEAFDAAGEILLAGMAEASETVGSDVPFERFEAAVGSYFDLLIAQPGFARLFLVEAHAAGPAALARRAALQGRIVDAMVDLLELRAGEDRFACEVIVAGVGALVTAPLVAGDPEPIRRLRAPVLAHVRRVLAP